MFLLIHCPESRQSRTTNIRLPASMASSLDTVSSWMAVWQPGEHYRQGQLSSQASFLSRKHTFATPPDRSSEGRLLLLETKLSCEEILNSTSINRHCSPIALVCRLFPSLSLAQAYRYLSHRFRLRNGPTPILPFHSWLCQ